MTAADHSNAGWAGEQRQRTMSTLQDMIDQIERKEFEQWYATNAFNFERDPIGSRDCGLQWAAWSARGARFSRCRGVTHPGCNYLAACGTVCNKCGQLA